MPRPLRPSPFLRTLPLMEWQAPQVSCCLLVFHWASCFSCQRDFGLLPAGARSWPKKKARWSGTPTAPPTGNVRPIAGRLRQPCTLSTCVIVPASVGRSTATFCLLWPKRASAMHTRVWRYQMRPVWPCIEPLDSRTSERSRAWGSNRAPGEMLPGCTGRYASNRLGEPGSQIQANPALESPLRELAPGQRGGIARTTSALMQTGPRAWEVMCPHLAHQRPAAAANGFSQSPPPTPAPSRRHWSDG